MARYSCGPFSRVYFFHTLRNGLRTYTNRRNRVEESNCQLHTVSSSFAGGPMFSEVYVDTAMLAPVKALMTSCQHDAVTA